jgi:hypothetical protein
MHAHLHLNAALTRGGLLLLLLLLLVVVVVVVVVVGKHSAKTAPP